MTIIKVGRLLRAGISGFVAGCSVDERDIPAFGSLVSVKPNSNDNYKIYGMIYNIHVDDDDFIRQIATVENITEEVILDNRINRIVPVEMSVLTVGYEENGKVSHLLPPRPPLSLDVIYKCSDEDLIRFTGSGRFGYFRHILRAQDAPIGEMLAAHVQQAALAHGVKSRLWKEAATNEIIALLRDDYATLMSVLGALSDGINEVK